RYTLRLSFFFLVTPRPPSSTLFPYTTLFRSAQMLSRQRMITIDVYIELTNLQHHRFPGTVRRIDGHFHTGLQFVFELVVVEQMFNGNTLNSAFAPFTVRLFRTQIQRQFVTGLLALQCRLHGREQVIVTVKI